MKSQWGILAMISLYGCSTPTHEEENKANNLSVVDEVVVHNSNESNAESPDTSIVELIKKWTWNDRPDKPSKSSITNATFPINRLLRTWTMSDGRRSIEAMTFENDSVSIHGEKKYIYTISHDSLRIFTSYERPGDGYSRGIIAKLTKDTLTIEWSTDDMNIYVAKSDK